MAFLLLLLFVFAVILEPQAKDHRILAFFARWGAEALGFKVPKKRKAESPTPPTVISTEAGRLFVTPLTVISTGAGRLLVLRSGEICCLHELRKKQLSPLRTA